MDPVTLGAGLVKGATVVAKSATAASVVKKVAESQVVQEQINKAMDSATEFVKEKKEASTAKKEEKQQGKVRQELQIQLDELIKELGGHYLKRWLETDEIAESATHFIVDIKNHLNNCVLKIQSAIVSETLSTEGKVLLAELKKLDELSSKAKTELGAFYWHEYEKTKSCEPTFEHLYKRIGELSSKDS